MLSPAVIRCAKQVYTHLGMREKIPQISSPLSEAPREIQILQRLDELNPTMLTLVIRHFLQWTPHEAKKTLEDLVEKLNSAIQDTYIQLQQDTSAVKKRSLPQSSQFSSLQTPSFSLPLEFPTFSHEHIAMILSPKHIFSDTHWIMHFEMSRFLIQAKCQWTDLPVDILSTLLHQAKTQPRTIYHTLQTWYKSRFSLTLSDTNEDCIIEKCPEYLWLYMKSETKRKSVHYTGSFFLHLNRPPTFILHPPKIAPSNRFFRKYGDDRFLEFKMGKNTRASLFKPSQPHFLHPIVLMNRMFQFLFIKEDRIVYFATEGEGLVPQTIRQVVHWHLPLLENATMTISKYSSRMTLGYSNSVSTLAFAPSAVHYIEDTYGSAQGKEETCMTDGCGIISCSAMRKVMGCQHADELPCAVQGRIAGAKGIWILSPTIEFESGEWIQIRQSQHKFNTGLPQPDLNNRMDPLHYTFDLVKGTVCVYPSKLNTQFIQCLSAGGVPASVFVEILEEHLHKLATIVIENQNIKVLRDWVARMGGVMQGRWEADPSDNDDSEIHSNDESSTNESISSISNKAMYWRINAYSGMPGSLYESTIRMIDSGFDLTNPYIANKVTSIFREAMRSLMAKYRIDVEQSCTVTCVPDPTGTLEEGEVFLQLSRRRTDERSSMPTSTVLGDILVTRNPCGLKSDIQKVKAVDCAPLRVYTDIIVFPTKGTISLASMLGGGDYDGDIVFCCWDQRMVEPFQSSPVLPTPIKVENAFDKCTTTLVQSVLCHKEEEAQEKALQEMQISIDMPDGVLGKYDNWRTILTESTCFDNEDVVYLAHMCAKLVDASKQGLTLKPAVLIRDTNDFIKVPQPQWFVDKRNRQREKDVHSYIETNKDFLSSERSMTTAMDYLYDTLLRKVDQFTKFSRSIFREEDIALRDPVLEAPWLEVMKIAKSGDTALLEDLKKIQHAIDRNINEYNHAARSLWLKRQKQSDNRYDPGKAHSPFVEESSRFTTGFELEEQTALNYLQTPPSDSFTSDILVFDIEANHGQIVQNIKASYAYIRTIQTQKFSKYCYIVAYDALRRLKADAFATRKSNLSESVVPSVYIALNLDKQWLKRARDANSSKGCGVRMSSEFGNYSVEDKTDF
ncbi:RNA dependent RNA polymerase-domain-containing protein [Spinellus fusiger]|nr:RNA dependent RNA polymerase-domain-containing protein [Spinellus fusiger]